MAKLIQLRRLYRLAGCLLLGYIFLALRLVDTHVMQHDRLYAKEVAQSEFFFNLRPSRGEIRDVHGQVLATNEEVKKVCADPTLMLGFQARIAALLAEHLGGDAAVWGEKIALKPILDEGQPRLRDGKIVFNQFVVLQDKVPVSKWEALERAMAELDLGIPDESALSSRKQRELRRLRERSVFARTMPHRIYPHGATASHVIGYLRKHQKQTGRGMVDDYVGAYGIEHSFDKLLEGSWGYRREYWYPERRYHPAFRQDYVPAVPGMRVYLTIDLRIQQFVEEQLEEIRSKHDPVSASAIVVRPATGEILAMANLPTFDPNDKSHLVYEQVKNRAITDALDPGSVFKIVTIAAGLNEGVVTLRTPVYCEEGRWIYRGIPLKDDAHEFGMLSVKEIVQHSSNIGTAKVSLMLGESRLFEYIQRFGFGAKTGIPLIGESVGLVTPPSRWDGITITRVAIGQSISVTPMQMIMAFAAVANDGYLMRPKLVDRIEDSEGRIRHYPAQRVRRVITPSVAHQLTEALQAVLTGGTGKNAVLANYRVAGKTGTAEQAGFRNGRWTMKSGKHAASFIGFFPATNPELCISVVVNQPRRGSYYGGTTAAPYWRQIALQTAQYLNIPSDKTEEELFAESGTFDSRGVHFTQNFHPTTQP